MSNSPDSPETWLRNFRPHINGDRVNWLSYHLSLVAGGTVVLKMEYEFSALIGTPQGVIALQCEPGIDMTGIEISPSPGQLIEMVTGSTSLSWRVSTDDAMSGELYIYFTLPNYPVVSDSPHLSGEIFDVPWLSEFTFLVNDEEVSLNDLYLPVVDGGVCKLTLNYDGSTLSGKQGVVVALEFKPGGEADGLEADKPLGELVAMEDGQVSINWYISSRPDATNASFELQLNMPEIFGMPASPPLRGSIVNNVWDQFSAWFNGAEVSLADLWFYIVNGEAVTLKLDFGSSALPDMPGAAVSLGFAPGAEVDGLIVTPDLGQSVLMAGLNSVTWEISLESDAVSGPFGLSWEIHGVAAVPASPRVSGNVFNKIWNDFIFVIDGVPVDSAEPWIPVADKRPSILMVGCESSSLRGLKGAGLAVEWKSGAEIEGLNVRPLVGVTVPIEAGTKTLNWTYEITPEAKSQPFEMCLSMPGFERVAKYSVRGHTYNKVWERDVKLYVDGIAVTWGDLTLPLKVGKKFIVELDFGDGWLTDCPDTHVSLEYGSAEVERILDSYPQFGDRIKIVKGTSRLAWALTVDPSERGSFELFFKIPEYKGLPLSPRIPGSVIDFLKEVSVKFDQFPLLLGPGKNAYPCRGAKHRITIIPDLSTPLLNSKVKLVPSGTSAEALGITIDLSEKMLTKDGAIFELDCTNAVADGWFALQLCSVELEQISLPLSMFLGHNLVTATRWTTPWATPPGFADFIRATSVFLNTAAPGVDVKVSFRGDTYMRKNSTIRHLWRCLFRAAWLRI